MGICNDRVVIITGAGGGLGREYALAFGAEGAKVVVNDIREDAAQAVVDEIKAAGGEAIPATHDITRLETAQKIVDDAVAAYGEVHVLLNNAGINRDKMFINMSEEDWDAVMAVHLRGHFCLAKILGSRWRDAAKAGNPVDARIINTTSGAGLQGSVGQSNYSAAKGGICSLTLVQAAELGRYGVTANAIAPAARTAMTEEVFADAMKAPEDGGFDFFHAGNVAPLLVWLGSVESKDVTGRVFEAQGGEISLADGWRTGPKKDKGAKWEPSEIGAAVAELIDQAQPAQKVYGT